VNTGIVRFGYLDLAFLGDESQWAAEASECADEQGKFWEYHDKLFASQSGENEGAFSKVNLEKFAAPLGLDAAKFNTCLDTDKYAKVVSDETALAGQYGISSTPTFLVDTQVVQGAQPFQVFAKIIDAEKAQAK
jgi:protein-disulfide isomerase